VTTPKEQRDELLDELLAATNDYYDAESQRIEDEVTFLKSVLRGRTGSERLNRSNTDRARVLVINDLESFLAGEG
jgi:hypothetical protein